MEEKKYIDAQTAVNYVMAAMQKYDGIKLKRYIIAVVEAIRDVPADVRENVHGEWDINFVSDERYLPEFKQICIGIKGRKLIFARVVAQI